MQGTDAMEGSSLEQTVVWGREGGVMLLTSSWLLFQLPGKEKGSEKRQVLLFCLSKFTAAQGGVGFDWWHHVGESDFLFCPKQR